MIQIERDGMESKSANDRARAKEDAEGSLALLRATLEAIADGIVAVDSFGRIAECNRQFLEMWGIPEAAIASPEESQFLALVLPQLKDAETFSLQVEELGECSSARSHHHLALANGKLFECHSQPQRLGEAIVGRVWTFRDITHLTSDWDGDRSLFQSEVKSQRLQAQLQNSLKELSDIKFALDRAAIVAITDTHGVITYVNNKFCELSQYKREELLGQTHRIVNSGYHPKGFFRDLWQTISSGKIWRGEIKNQAKDGTYYWVYTTIVPFLDNGGKPFQYLTIRFDITERKRVEEALQKSEAKLRQKTQQLLSEALHDLKRTQAQLIHAEKMSSLGQMVAGIAHELNNPVSFIYGNMIYVKQYVEDLLYLMQSYARHYQEPVLEIQALADRIDLDFLIGDLPNLLASMKTGAERIRNLVLSLRNFARLDEAEIKQVDIHEGIESTLLILQHRLRSPEATEIEVRKEYTELPPVEAHSAQLNQVFLSVLNNAIEALEEGTGDRMGRWETKPCPLIRIRTEVISDRRVAIRIADNGPGMTEAVRDRLFDPFFTTKPVGKGMGLGLSISYQIVVEKHGGQIDCISAPGRGTEFIIAIPISQPPQKNAL